MFVPGMLMAAARLNIPSIYVGGGPMLAGRYNDKVLDLVRGAFEGVGSYNDGKITKDELDKIEEYSCPSCGSCAGLFTANTMNCLAEALGMALPGTVLFRLHMEEGDSWQSVQECRLWSWSNRTSGQGIL